METLHNSFLPDISSQTEDRDLERQRKLWVKLTGDQMQKSTDELSDSITASVNAFIRLAERGKEKESRRFAIICLNSILRFQFTRMLVAAGQISQESQQIKEYLANVLPENGVFGIDKVNIQKLSEDRLPDSTVTRFIRQHPGIAHATAVMPLMALLTGVGIIGVAGGFALGQEGIRTFDQTSDFFRKLQDSVVFTWATYENENGEQPHMQDFQTRLYIAASVRFPDTQTIDEILDNFQGWSSSQTRRRKVS